MGGLLSRYEKVLLKRLESKCYTSIDTLPIYNWWQIHKTDNFKLLLINPYNRASLEGLVLIWKQLYDQYFEKFGLGDTFISILEKKKEIALLKCERWVSGDKSMETEIKVAELELDQLENLGGSDFLETKAFIEKTLNFQINMKETSVSEFYTYLKTAIENGGRKN